MENIAFKRGRSIKIVVFMKLRIAEENYWKIWFSFRVIPLNFVTLLKNETPFNEYHGNFDWSLNSNASGKDL